MLRKIMVLSLCMGKMLESKIYHLRKRFLNVLCTCGDTSDVLISILAFLQHETNFFLGMSDVCITNQKEPSGNPH